MLLFQSKLFWINVSLSSPKTFTTKTSFVDYILYHILYHRAKTKEDKSEILAEINSIQPTIKELRKYDKYCKDIKDRSESIQNNLDNFDKDIQKEKDNSRSLWLKLSFLLSIYTSIKCLKISHCNA